MPLGRCHSRIELDQAFSGTDQLAFVDIDGRTTLVSSGWIRLVLPLGMILPLAVATISTVPQVAHTIATQKIRFRLPLPQRLLPISCDGREKVADDPARAGLDFDRHRHARAEFDELVLHLHVRAVE